MPLILLLAPWLLLAALGQIAWWWLLPYALLSPPAYLLYWRDKRAAERGGWRTPEWRLHLLQLCGGWPGAWLARHHLRHKTRKQPFRSLFWLSVLLNLGALLGGYWLTRQGG